MYSISSILNFLCWLLSLRFFLGHLQLPDYIFHIYWGFELLFVSFFIIATYWRLFFFCYFCYYFACSPYVLEEAGLDFNLLIFNFLEIFSNDALSVICRLTLSAVNPFWGSIFFGLLHSIFKCLLAHLTHFGSFGQHLLVCLYAWEDLNCGTNLGFLVGRMSTLIPKTFFNLYILLISSSLRQRKHIQGLFCFIF